MTSLLTRWLIVGALVAIVSSLARLFKGQVRIMAGLDDIKTNQAAEKALIEKLGFVKGVPAGTFTADQQAEIDQIVADQQATLAEDTTSTPGV